MDKLLLRPVEVAEVLGIGRSLVYQLIASGDIPSIRIGGPNSRRVPITAIHEWIANKQKKDIS
jgi:excisionase family DNA binding protein